MSDEKYEIVHVLEKFPYLTKQIETLEAAIDSDLPVIIKGETGTGKAVLAKQIHFASRGKHTPCKSISLSHITDELLAGELFGYRKGAFTGAVSDHPGIIRDCSGGTLILEDFTHMSIRAQQILLQVFDNVGIRGVGEREFTLVDVRIIVTTNDDIGSAIRTGQFRRDLFARLASGEEITLPALNTLPIGLIKPIFCEMVLAARKKHPHPEVNGHFDIEDDVLAKIVQFVPHNFRGLLKTAERLKRINVPCIGYADLPNRVTAEWFTPEGTWATMNRSQKCAYAQSLLQQHEGNVSRTAKSMEIPTSTFRYYLSKK